MQSIGYVEVIGLSDAVMVGDRMLKAASVAIKNIENAHGGYITVSVTGDVAAVEAAVEAGIGDARIHVVSTDILANPGEGVAELGQTDVFGTPAPKQPTPAVPVPRPSQTPTKTTKAVDVVAKESIVKQSSEPTPQKNSVKPRVTKTASTTKSKPAVTKKITSTRRKTSRSRTTKKSTTNRPPKDDSK